MKDKLGIEMINEVNGIASEGANVYTNSHRIFAEFTDGALVVIQHYETWDASTDQNIVTKTFITLIVEGNSYHSNRVISNGGNYYHCDEYIAKSKYADIIFNRLKYTV